MKNKAQCPECGSNNFKWTTCQKCGWDAFDNHTEKFLKNLEEIIEK